MNQTYHLPYYTPLLALREGRWCVSRRMAAYGLFAAACIYAHKRNKKEGRV